MKRRHFLKAIAAGICTAPALVNAPRDESYKVPVAPERQVYDRVPQSRLSVEEIEELAIMSLKQLGRMKFAEMEENSKKGKPYGIDWCKV